MSKTFLMAPGQRVCSDLENKVDKDGCAEICLLGADWEEVIIKHNAWQISKESIEGRKEPRMEGGLQLPFPSGPKAALLKNKKDELTDTANEWKSMG